MNKLFSFKNKEILATKGDLVEIFASSKFNAKITVRIESNVESLNGFYSINGNGPILQFKFDEETTLKATRVWGTTWDFDGILDCAIKENSNVTLDVEPALGSIETKKSVRSGVASQYSSKSRNNKGFNRKIYHLNKSVDNNYSIVINSKDVSERGISTTSNATIVVDNLYDGTYDDRSITVQLSTLVTLGVVLKFKIDGTEYDILGQEIDDASHLDLLVRQLKLALEQHSIKNVFFYQDNDSLYITKSTAEVKNVHLIGAMNSIYLTFDKPNKNDSKLSITHIPPVTQWNKDIITITSNDSELKYSICNIHILNHDKPNIELQSNYDGNSCYITLILDYSLSIDTDWMLISNEHMSYYNIQTLKANQTRLQWIVKVDSKLNNNLNFKCKSTLGSAETSLKVYETIKADKFYYNVTFDKLGAILTVRTNQKAEELQTFNVEVLKRSKSVENVDFKLQQKQFSIHKGQKEKRIKIVWLSKKPYQECNLKINNIFVPIKYVNTAYYPTSFNVIKYDHILNRVCANTLTLKYYDKNVSGTLILKPAQSRFDYFPNGDEVLWQLFDGKQMIWEKTIFYNIHKNELDVIYPSFVKYNTNFKIEFKLLRTYTKPVKFRIISESNIDFNMNNEFEIKINENSATLSLSSNRKKSVGWLAFRVVSLNTDIDSGFNKHIIMFE